MLSLVSRTRGAPWQLSKHLQRTIKASFLGYQVFVGPHGIKKGCGKTPADAHCRCLILSSFRSSRLFPSAIIYMRLPLTSRELPIDYSQSRSTPWYPEWANNLAWCRRTIVYLDHFKVRKSSFSRGLFEWFYPTWACLIRSNRYLLYQWPS